MIRIPNDHVPRDARPGQQIRSGDFFSVKVVRNEGGGRWTVSLGGRLFPAFSEHPLSIGQKIRVQALWNGDTLMLRLPQKLPLIPRLLGSVGLPTDALSRLVVSMLARTGLALNPQRILRLRNILASLPRADRDGARLLALLEEKGIEPTSAELQLLLSLSGGDAGTGGGDRRKEGRSGGEKGEIPVPELSDLFRNRMVRYTEQGDSPLQLFNHLPGADGQWVVLPFAVRIGNREMNGSMRLLLGRDRGRVRSMSLEVNDGPHRWRFAMGADRKLTLFSPDPGSAALGRKLLPELAGKLGKMRVEIDDTMRDIRESDGFGGSGDDVPLKGIDTQA